MVKMIIGTTAMLLGVLVHFGELTEFLVALTAGLVVLFIDRRSR